MNDKTGTGDLTIKPCVNFRRVDFEEIEKRYKKPGCMLLVSGFCNVAIAACVATESPAVGILFVGMSIAQFLMHAASVRQRDMRVLSDVLWEAKNEVRWEMLNRINMDQDKMAKEWIEGVEEIRKMP